VTGFLLLLGMGLVAWYAWPAAPSFAARVWTVFFAVFLCPFSWPWLVARGYRVRKLRRTIEANSKRIESEQLRAENIEWWTNEYFTAWRAGDQQRTQLALEVLAAMGVRNPSGGRTS
jgi:hypothetical protein